MHFSYRPYILYFWHPDFTLVFTVHSGFSLMAVRLQVFFSFLSAHKLRHINRPKKKKVNNMSTRERPRKTQWLDKMAKPSLKYHLQLKTKEKTMLGCWRYWLGNSKGRKAIYMKVEKQRFSKQMFAETLRDNQFSSVQFSCSVMSNSLQPHGLQHARLPCPSTTPRVYSNFWETIGLWNFNRLC